MSGSKPTAPVPDGTELVLVHPLAAQVAELMGAARLRLPKLFELCSALGLVYRRAVECQYENESNKQVAVARATTAHLPAVEAWARDLSERMAAGKPADEGTRDPVTQPYVATMMRAFAPSMIRFAALARVVRLPPSVLALMAEVVLAKHGGKCPKRDSEADTSPAVYDALRRLAVRAGAKPKAEHGFRDWVCKDEPERAVYAAFPEGVARAVREWRVRRGWTQADLAAKLGAAGEHSGTAVSQVENFRHSPSWPKLHALACIFEQPISSILYEAELQAAELVNPLARLRAQGRELLLRANLTPDERARVERFLSGPSD